MSYKALFCLGVTTLLTASSVPALATRATTDLLDFEPLPLNAVNTEQSSQVSLQKYKSMNLVFATQETKSNGVPQGSSRPPRG